LPHASARFHAKPVQDESAYTERMDHIDFSPWLVKTHSRLKLSSLATLPNAKDLPTDEAWQSRLNKLGDKLNKLQSTLHAGKSKGLLLVFQGMDTAGKDGVIRSVFTHISPLGVRAEAFGAPSELEKNHDFLWRIHQKAPARGEMAIFNRSHYEDVLVTRVRGWIDKKKCEERYAHIQHFESLLHDEGITVLKCYLHISKAEQKKRLQARLDDPHKHWKLQPSDFEDRQLWPKFIDAYEDAMAATSTPQAPWYVVPADSKPYRDLFVAELLVQTLENMKLEMPQPLFDLSKVQLD
jgi:PPK2 family polyphosphate:nucleotide phosphotransferase